MRHHKGNEVGLQAGSSVFALSCGSIFFRQQDKKKAAFFSR
jgi:ribosomal protein L27